MPEIEIELTAELIDAIKAKKGTLSISEFIEIGMKASMKPKEQLNKAYFRKR